MVVSSRVRSLREFVQPAHGYMQPVKFSRYLTIGVVAQLPGRNEMPKRQSAITDRNSRVLRRCDWHTSITTDIQPLHGRQPIAVIIPTTDGVKHMVEDGEFVLLSFVGGSDFPLSVVGSMYFH